MSNITFYAFGNMLNERKSLYLLLVGERFLKVGHLSSSRPASKRNASWVAACHGHYHNRSEDSDWSRAAREAEELITVSESSVKMKLK